VFSRAEKYKDIKLIDCASSQYSLHPFLIETKLFFAQRDEKVDEKNGKNDAAIFCL